MTTSTDTPGAASPREHDAPLAVVTGASSGIGRKVALLLAMRGYRTLLLARREDRLARIARRLSRFAPSQALPADLLHPDAAAARLADTLDRLGPARVLVNNAGFGVYERFVDQTPDRTAALLTVNLSAPIALTAVTLPGMLGQRRGHVINIASVAGVMGPWGHAPYAAAKAGLTAFTQSLASEHRRDGVQFSAVMLGLIRTEFFNDRGYPELFARVARHALPASVAARRIVALLDRSRLQPFIPAHFRALQVITALAPSLAQRLVERESRPPGA